MRKAYSAEQKEQIFKRYAEVETVTSIHKTTGISRSTLYTWINVNNATSGKKKLLNIGSYYKLKNIAKSLKTLSQFLKLAVAPLKKFYHFLA